MAKLRQVFIELNNAAHILELANITELSGYPNYYRIKFDYRYRIGIYFDGEIIEFSRIGAREDFYER